MFVNSTKYPSLENVLDKTSKLKSPVNETAVDAVKKVVAENKKKEKRHIQIAEKTKDRKKK